LLQTGFPRFHHTSFSAPGTCSQVQGKSRSDSVESRPVGASCFRPVSNHCLTLTLLHPIPPQPLVIWKGEYRVSSNICTFLYPGAPYNTICFLELHNFPFQFTKILPLIWTNSNLKFSKHVCSSCVGYSRQTSFGFLPLIGCRKLIHLRTILFVFFKIIPITAGRICECNYLILRKGPSGIN
jgi:hypothetical protein